MKKHLIYLLLAGAAAGCTSKTETSGVNDVIDFYGGSLTYKKGYTTATEEEKYHGKYFELALSDAHIRQNFPTPDLPASNCAWLFYHALSKTEKASYSFIRVLIIDSNQTNTYHFLPADLDMVEQGLVTLRQTEQYVERREIDSLIGQFNEIVPADSLKKERVLASILRIDSAYGKIKRFVFQGFSFSKWKDEGQEKRLLELSGTLVREKENTIFSVLVDPERTRKSLYKYMYDL